MDLRDQPALVRSHHSPGQIRVRSRLEWTRKSGTGPDAGILGQLAGRAVVELGCGSGHNLAHLVAVEHAVGVGIDHDPAKIRQASKLYGQLDHLRFVRDDAAAYLAALAPSSVDVCLSIFGAFSFTPAGPLLAAAGRALRPGGLLALTVRLDDQHDRVIILARR
jgi:SAM-dependent methyltransferase